MQKNERSGGKKIIKLLLITSVRRARCCMQPVQRVGKDWQGVQKLMTRKRKMRKSANYSRLRWQTKKKHRVSAPALLPEDCWKMVFSFASNADLSSVIPSVCKDFLKICSEADEWLWRPRCLQLWNGKVESSWKDFVSNTTTSFREKYMLSLEDSQRTELTADELCSFTWAFRFTPLVGEWWTSLDPYWANNNQNGPSSYLVRSFRKDGTKYNPGPPDEVDNYAIENNMNIKWRFTRTRRSMETGVVGRGHFVQVNRWPSLVIERSKGDWGWIMKSQWGVHAYPPDNIFDTKDLDDDIFSWV